MASKLDKLKLERGELEQVESTLQLGEEYTYDVKAFMNMMVARYRTLIPKKDEPQSGPRIAILTNDSFEWEYVDPLANYQWNGNNDNGKDGIDKNSTDVLSMPRLKDKAYKRESIDKTNDNNEITTGNNGNNDPPTPNIMDDVPPPTNRQRVSRSSESSSSSVNRRNWRQILVGLSQNSNVILARIGRYYVVCISNIY